MNTNSPSPKLPAIQWYVGDWRKDPGVQALDYEHRGVWFEILMLMWESEFRGKLLLNGGPMPDEALARLLGLPLDKTKQILSKLLAYGVADREADTEALYCRRMVRDELERRQKVEAGRLGGQATQEARRQAEGQPTGDRTPTSSVSSSPSVATSNTYTDTFEQWWNSYPRKVKKHRSFTCWKARLKEGVTVEELTAALERYNTKLKAEGTEEEFIQHPTTFLAKGGGYVEEWKLKRTSVPGTQGGAEGGILDPKFSQPMEPIIHERPPPVDGETKGNVGKLAEGLIERAKVKT